MAETKHHLNIYKLSSEIKKIDEIEIPSDDPRFIIESEQLDGDFKYRIFVQRNKDREPAWYSLMQPFLNPDYEKTNPIINKNSNFVMIVDFKGVLYALTGGFGNTKIRRLIDDEFGLRMALRMLDSNTISNILQKPLKSETRQIWRSVSGYRPDLDLANYRRIQKALDGRSIDDDLPGITVSGKSALSINVATRAGKLREVFKKLQQIEKKRARLTFPKSYEIVKNSKAKKRLNEKMIIKLNDYLEGKGGRDDLYLEVKDPFMQFRCEDFQLHTKKHNVAIDNIDLSIVKSELMSKGIKGFKSVDDLLAVKITGKDCNGYPLVDAESLKELLVCEIEYNKAAFIYINKKWYKILDDLKRYVEEETRKIVVSKNMPDWDTSKFHGQKGEHDYCDYAESVKGWKNLDFDLVRVKKSTPIELCDLYNKEENEFIFVKKTWGSKSSYLFNQGLVSAEANNRYPEFRDECKTKWPELFDGKFKPNSKIVFAIAHEKATDADFPNNLSFFAKLNLLQVIEKLRTLQYQVEIAPIKLV